MPWYGTEAPTNRCETNIWLPYPSSINQRTELKGERRGRFLLNIGCILIPQNVFHFSAHSEKEIFPPYLSRWDICGVVSRNLFLFFCLLLFDLVGMGATPQGWNYLSLPIDISAFQSKGWCEMRHNFTLRWLQFTLMITFKDVHSVCFSYLYECICFAVTKELKDLRTQCRRRGQVLCQPQEG